MTQPSVYLDTTIPSYLFTKRTDLIVQAHHQITEKWWREDRPRFNLFISEVVIRELQKGQSELSRLRLEAISEIPVLDSISRIDEVARYYMDQLAMPSRDEHDAYHLAFASVYKIDYLITWNCAHLANANKRRHLERLNRKLHLPLPVICTPQQLMQAPLPEDPHVERPHR